VDKKERGHLGHVHLNRWIWERESEWVWPDARV